MLNNDKKSVVEVTQGRRNVSKIHHLVHKYAAACRTLHATSRSLMMQQHLKCLPRTMHRVDSLIWRMLILLLLLYLLQLLLVPSIAVE